MDEARLEQSEYGTVAATEGWFAVNVRDAAWVTNEAMGDACIFEGDAVPFGQIGYTLQVLQPGQPSGMYHREGDQEDFLVLSGECIAIIEGTERPLKAWDFVHCPPGTDHIFVGAGDGPCVIFMAGARQNRGSTVYLRDEVALRHGAGVQRETPRPGPTRRMPEVAPGPPGDDAVLASRAGGVALALAHDHRALADRVADADRALAHRDLRGRAGVPREPARAADGRRRVAALGAELALAVAPELARLGLLLLRRARLARAVELLGQGERRQARDCVTVNRPS